MRLALFVLIAVLALEAGTGCSQGKQANSSPATTGTTTASAPKLSPAVRLWVKQVNAACRPWQDRIDAVTPAPTDNASLRKWLRRALPLISAQVAAVQAVQQPANAEDAQKVTLFTNGVLRTERALTRYLAAIRAHKPAKVTKTALADAGAAGAASRTRATGLGITGCGGQ